MSTTGFARSLIAFNPSPRRWPIAVAAGLSMAVPVAVGALAGRTDLGLLASLGAFTSLYFGAEPRRRRLRLLPVVALALVAVAALGALVAPSHPATLVGLAAVAVASAVGTVATRLGPPGAIMFILVFGISAQLTGPISSGGAGVAPGPLLGLLAAGCVAAYLISALVMSIPAVRWPAAAAAFATPRRRDPIDATDRLSVARQVMASLLGVGLVTVIGEPRGYWVVGASVAILSIGHRHRVTVVRAVHRITGTVVGVGVFALLALLHPQGIWLALLFGVLQFVIELVVIRHSALALTFITPLVLLLLSAAHPGSAGRIAVERLVDTGWGALIAVLVLGIVPARWFRERTAQP
ncbi:FUSC family protein [Nakamurella leprariae]|uniref:FUSC family protein n=1 Tax=Nakamurella leprariae TaxID=2803911 RepID=A0A938YJM6_9ACTN|nr:FUSC family protein [Nakamurella leprariae]MBM9469010.1 FUSC family protein [Nakamurella leprariae]